MQSSAPFVVIHSVSMLTKHLSDGGMKDGETDEEGLIDGVLDGENVGGIIAAVVGRNDGGAEGN